MKFQMGVFQIRNTANNKILIESSNDLVSIWNRNKFQLQMAVHTNEVLQKEWNQFGESNFVFEILCELEQDDSSQRNYKEELLELEKMYIDDLEPFDEKGYNSRKRKV